MSAHTPGPWHAWQPIGEEWAVTTDSPMPPRAMPIRVADEIDSEADARLIATAPDLLEALEWVLEMESDCNRCRRAGQRCVGHSAVAKARGQS